MSLMLKVVVYIVLFALLLYAVYTILHSIGLIDSAKESLNEIYTKLHDQNTARVEQLEKARRKYGRTSMNAIGKESVLSRMLQKLDRDIVYSQLPGKFKWLNTTTFVVLELVVSSVLFMLTLFLYNSLVISLFVFAIVLILPYIYILHRCDVNYLKTEGELRYFVTSVANNSVATDDIVSVMESIAPSVKEPLCGAINRAISASRVTGSKTDCMRSLIHEIEHPLFVRFIRDLEVCGQYHANFASVATNAMVQINVALEESESNRAHMKNARGDIYILLVLGIAFVCLLSFFFEYTPLQLFVKMQTSFLGQVCLISAGTILLGTAVYVLVGMRR